MTPGMREKADRQLERLARTKFRPDPVLASHSLLASIFASVPKRHGPLIEAAIIEALQAAGYVAWREKKYWVANAVDHLVQAQTLDEIALTALPYRPGGRSLQVDLLAYCPWRRRLGAYEIKRANGNHDSGKLRSLRRDVAAVQATLLSYGRERGLVIDKAISRVIFYYGRVQLPPPWSITGGAVLDHHFGKPVSSAVDEMTDYFRTRLHDFIENLDSLRPEVRQLALELG